MQLTIFRMVVTGKIAYTNILDNAAQFFGTVGHRLKNIPDPEQDSITRLVYLDFLLRSEASLIVQMPSNHRFGLCIEHRHHDIKICIEEIFEDSRWVNEIANNIEW
ncbi:hypothetical protein GCM10028785_09460 [Hydrogenophaga soli]